MRYAYIEETSLEKFRQKIEFWSTAGFTMKGQAQIAFTPCDDGYYTYRISTMEKSVDD